ncbi:hypothetical protein ACSLBF_21005 (plasmid) [Pseudoalteromonas sp. T1lg65]|uniref:hypothetical protein n=1 Tax=Pseudoalteromonas sp. T1lg65 TaxID=2077101 RepID=UPI003F79E956
MVVEYNKHKKITTTQFILVIGSIVFMLLTAYTSNLLSDDLEQFNLSEEARLIFIVFSAVGLPVVSLCISQLLVKWRGVDCGIKAVFYSSLIVLLAQIPFLFS